LLTFSGTIKRNQRAAENLTILFRQQACGIFRSLGHELLNQSIIY